jgi:uncharacterized damage-inducible protein DinB
VRYLQRVKSVQEIIKNNASAEDKRRMNEYYEQEKEILKSHLDNIAAKKQAQNTSFTDDFNLFKEKVLMNQSLAAKVTQTFAAAKTSQTQQQQLINNHIFQAAEKILDSTGDSQLRSDYEAKRSEIRSVSRELRKAKSALEAVSKDYCNASQQQKLLREQEKELQNEKEKSRRELKEKLSSSQEKVSQQIHQLLQ